MAKTQKYKYTKDEKNVSEARTVTVQYMAKNKEFNMGYADFNSGIWRKEYETWGINQQWNYERGRSYAAAGGPQIKNGRTTRVQALWFIQDMLVQKIFL